MNAEAQQGIEIFPAFLLLLIQAEGAAAYLFGISVSDDSKYLLVPAEESCNEHRHRAVAGRGEENEHRSDEEVSPDECRVDENGEYCEDGDQYAGDGEHDPLYVPRRGIHAIDVRHMFY